MAKRKFIKVIATELTGEPGSTTRTRVARGIKMMSSEQTTLDFIKEFMLERGLPRSYVLHRRDEDLLVMQPFTLQNTPERTSLAYNFIEFDVADIGYYAKDLSIDELSRDLAGIQELTNE